MYTHTYMHAVVIHALSLPLVILRVSEQVCEGADASVHITVGVPVFDHARVWSYTHDARLFVCCSAACEVTSKKERNQRACSHIYMFRHMHDAPLIADLIAPLVSSVFLQHVSGCCSCGCFAIYIMHP